MQPGHTCAARCCEQPLCNPLSTETSRCCLSPSEALAATDLVAVVEAALRKRPLLVVLVVLAVARAVVVVVHVVLEALVEVVEAAKEILG